MKVKPAFTQLNGFLKVLEKDENSFILEETKSWVQYILT